MKCKNTFSDLDPLPATVFYEYLDILVPHITIIFNESLANGLFPVDFKDSLVIPLIKKLSLDCNMY